MSDAFKRVEPGSEPAPPPESLQTWCTQTMYGVIGGMLYGGILGLRQSRDASIASPTVTNSVAHRATVFFVRESILTGSRIGLFASMFSAVALATRHARDREDAGNFAAAGALTCGLFSGGVAGWYGVPRGAAFGAAIGGMAGFAQGYLKEIIEVEEGQEEEMEIEEDEGGSVERVVNLYQTSLESHPLRGNRKD